MSITKEYNLVDSANSSTYPQGHIHLISLIDCTFQASLLFKWDNTQTEGTTETARFRLWRYNHLAGTEETRQDVTITHTSSGDGTVEYFSHVYPAVDLLSGDIYEMDFALSNCFVFLSTTNYSGLTQVDDAPFIFKSNSYYYRYPVGAGFGGSMDLYGSCFKVIYDEDYKWLKDANNGGYPYSADDYIYVVDFNHRDAGYAVDFWKLDSNNDGYPWTWGWTAPAGGGNWYIKLSDGTLAPITWYIKLSDGTLAPLSWYIKTQDSIVPI